MKNKSCCNQEPPAPVTSHGGTIFVLWGLLCVLSFAPPASAGSDAPQWMHALTNAPLPAHDEKTDAVLLYSENDLIVDSADRIRTHVRIAYKILRPSGRDYGFVLVPFNSHSKITSLRAWCIPAQGRDYEVKDKDAMEMSPPKIEGSELIRDVKVKILNIPAPDPGNIVGYEYEKRSSLTPCRMPGIFNAKFPHGNGATPYSFPPAGSSKLHG